MNPEIYLAEIVEPTVQEFLSEPQSRRHAFLACVTLYHCIDAIEKYHGIRKEDIRANLELRCQQYFRVVRDVANLAKHIRLDPRHPGNRARRLMTLDDLDVAAEPFSDGTYFTDGTGWVDGGQEEWGLRARHDKLISVKVCVERVLDGFRQYIAATNEQNSPSCRQSKPTLTSGVPGRPS